MLLFALLFRNFTKLSSPAVLNRFACWPPTMTMIPAADKDFPIGGGVGWLALVIMTTVFYFSARLRNSHCPTLFCWVGSSLFKFLPSNHRHHQPRLFVIRQLTDRLSHTMGVFDADVTSWKTEERLVGEITKFQISYC